MIVLAKPDCKVGLLGSQISNGFCQIGEISKVECHRKGVVREAYGAYAIRTDRISQTEFCRPVNCQVVLAENPIRAYHLGIDQCQRAVGRPPLLS